MGEQSNLGDGRQADDSRAMVVWQARQEARADEVRGALGVADLEPGDGVGPAPGSRLRRGALYAAGLALTAGLGWAAGFSSSSEVPAQRVAEALPVVASAAEPAAASADLAGMSEDIRALKESLASLSESVATLQTDARAEPALGAALDRMAARLDRIERQDGERVATLVAVQDKLDKVERQNAPTAALPKAPAPTQPSAAREPEAPEPPRPVLKAEAKARPDGAIRGWAIRDVHRGVALVQGRTGLFEVGPGDILPGAGRVESIRKKGGEWVVVTSRGIILEQ